MTRDLWPDVDRIVSAALERQDSEREAYVRSACAGRADLEAEIISLLAEEERGGPLDAIDAMPDGGHRIGPYRLIREIGRGGMGSVWLAERDDQQFRKQVAIKFLSAGLPVTEALRRFREERQILASLEHPHIARLLDAGRSEDGLHYMVMEFVEGVPITEHCAARRLTLRERAALLRTICATVHFAHQRLVVHRDLKPANILVTADGAPKLLDFGIAKMLSLVEPGAAFRTAPMMHPFTPAYASPEQLRGAPATTSTDVYSLGVLSYELLAGVNPHQVADGSMEAVVQAVCERDPEKPSVAAARRRGDAAEVRSTAAALTGDLDAIVLKAMRKAAEDRYASADDLADDFGRHLEGLPVVARRGTWRYRAQKFARRHRLGVAAAAVAVILAVTGVSAVVWQAGVARQERASAQRRFNDVRQLARVMIFDLYDRIADLPGSTAARQSLVTQALQYLDRLSGEVSGDRDLTLELATAYSRVGEVQGDPGRANLGDTTGALASYERAWQILDIELARRPADQEVQRLLARVYMQRGDLWVYLRKTTEARASYEAGQRLRHALAASGRDEDRRDLAGAYYRIADVVWFDDRAESVRIRREALQIYEALLAARPDDPQARRNAALTHKVIGSTLAELKKPDEAKPHLLKALALDEQRLRADPASTLVRLDLSFDLSLLAAAAHAEGNFAGALAYWQRVIDTRRDLANTDPKDARARGRLTYAYLASANTRVAMKDYRAALDDSKQALSLGEALVSANPQDSVSRFYVAQALATIGHSEQGLARSTTPPGERQAHHTRACAAFARALDGYRTNQAYKTTSIDVAEIARVEQEVAACKGGTFEPRR